MVHSKYENVNTEIVSETYAVSNDSSVRECLDTHILKTRVNSPAGEFNKTNTFSVC